MNFVCFKGRLANDPTYTRFERPGGSDRHRTYFNIAVPRMYTTGSKQVSDFFNCVIFGPRAVTLNKYFKKGDAILVWGHMENCHYTNKEGRNIYTMNVVMENFEFCTSKFEADRKKIEKLGVEADQMYDESGEFGEGSEDFVSVDDQDLPFE